MSLCRGSLVLVCFLAAAQAQHDQPAGRITAVPELIRFNASYRDPGQQPPPGPAGAIFSVYREQDGGTAVWSEVQNIELDKDGNYSVLLGSTTNDGLPADLFATGDQRWLEVELQLPGWTRRPRVLLASVPYAFKSADADMLGGRPASDYLLAPTAIATSSSSDKPQATSAGLSVMTVGSTHPRAENGTAGYIAMFSDPTDVVNSVLFQSGAYVGFGTTSPTHGLHVFNNSPIYDSNLNGQLYVQNTYPTNSQGHASLVLDKGSNSVSAALAFNSVGVQQWDVGATDDNNFHVRSLGGSSPKPLTIERGALANSLYVNASGNVGVGTSTPVAKLEVAGNAQVDGNLTVSGNIFAAGSAGPILLTPNDSSNNFAGGIGALAAVTTGNSDTAIGDNSLHVNTTGTGNTAVGSNSLASNTAGASKTLR